MGRPVGSRIRQNMLEIIFFLNKVHGYKLYLMYQTVYGKVAQKSIYYNLRKGVDTGEIDIDSAVREKGDFSWGDVAMKTYYKLGPNAQTKSLKYVSEALKRHKFIE